MRVAGAADAAPEEHDEYDDRPLGFFCSYPVKRTRVEMLQGLRARGLQPCFPKSERCVLQWSPFSRINWHRHLQGDLVVSSYFAHHGLVDKARLMQLLRAAGRKASSSSNSSNGKIDGLLSAFEVLQDPRTELAEAMSRQPDVRWWVLKRSDANNASQVFFVSAGETVACSELSTEEGGQWLLQAVVPRPLLFQGRKFHIRCNVLALGRLTVLVHRACVLHVACEPYRESDWDNQFVHVTNHVLQSTHPQYDVAHNIKTLKDLGEDLGAEIFEQICGAVATVFDAVQTVGSAKDFFPTPNAFEVFGFDFLASRGCDGDGELCVKLLEVNSGPALEGHEGMPGHWCKEVVGDILDVVVGPAQDRSVTSLDQGTLSRQKRTSGFRQVLPGRDENACCREVQGFSFLSEGKFPLAARAASGSAQRQAPPAPH